MKEWICKCGHIVLAVERPEPIRWSDGHVCKFVEKFSMVDFANTLLSGPKKSFNTNKEMK